MDLFEQTGEYTPDNLFAGNEVPVITENITIAKGQKLKRGAVIGKITETGEGQLVETSATDGSKVPYAILTDDVDTTDAAVETQVYLSGYFNAEALSVTTDEKVADYKDELRKLGIFTK